MELLELHKNSISNLCQKHKVKQLYAFGSVLTKNFNANSDIDFVVAFKPMKVEDYADNYFALIESLEKLLQRDVDLLEAQALTNTILIDNLNRNKQLIYGRAVEEIIA